MTNHSPEPWKLCQSGGQPDWRHRVVLDAVKGTVAHLEPLAGRDVDADGRRVVACVNACQGIPTEKLDEWGSALRGAMKIAQAIAAALGEKDETNEPT